MSHSIGNVVAVDVRCEFCSELLTPIGDVDEMTSQVRRYRCEACRLDYRVDASGMLVEDDGSGPTD